jgi:predicted nucleic acid-binding protein
MSFKVVDASALAAILFGEPGAQAVVEALADSKLLAPTLIEYELGNTCLKKCRRYPGLARQLRSSFGEMKSLDLRLYDVDSPATLALAGIHFLSFYDASYLWLAQELRLPLVTLDARMRKAYHDWRV